MTGSTSPRFRILSRLVLGGLVLSLAGAAGATLLPMDAASAATTDSTCTGVIVVVDFTEVDGGVKTGCAASGFDTGFDALHSAGFSSAESQPGLVCTIDAKPDPCPTTFEGSFWSYWHGDSGDAKWTSYQVGAATSHPVAGSVEGWRYNDGTAGPGLSPQDATAQATAAPSDAATAAPATAAPSDAATTPTTPAPRDQKPDPAPLIVTGVLVVLFGTAITMMLLKRKAGQDER